MNVLVVGSTGVIGQLTVRRLRAHGHDVRALVRDASRASTPVREDADVVVGDLLDGPSLEAAVEGCDAVINVASAIPTKTDPSPADWDRNDRVRTTGTRNLLDAMRSQGVMRLVHTSVYLVYGSDRGDEVLDETADLQPPPVVASAVEGEQLVEESPTAWTILRPGWLYDDSSWHTQQLLADLRAGRVPVVEGAPAWRSPVAASDVASAICLCLRQQATQLTLNIAADPVRWPDLIWGLARRLDAPSPTRLSTEEAASLPSSERQSLLRSIRMDTSLAAGRLGFSAEQPDTVEALTAIAIRRDQ